MRSESAIKAVIWHCGGVIVWTADDSGRRAWERKLGLSVHELDRVVMGSASWIQAQCGTMREDDYWADIRTQLRLDENALEDLRRDFYAGDRVNPAVIDVITRLRPRYKHTILSNAPASLPDQLWARFRVAHLFDAITVSATIGVMKPDPRAYDAALTALGLRAEETVFIDDLLPNIDAARQLGMHVIHFETAHYDVRRPLSVLLGAADL